MRYSAIFAAAAALLPLVSADCCNADKCLQPMGWDEWCAKYSCDDDTQGTPCCGYGGCNIFCCNCDGGCRRAGGAPAGRRGLMSARDDKDASDAAFNAADTDNSGNITMQEYTNYMNVGDNSVKHIAWFLKHDKNDDGVITPDEVSRD
ncbi:hypothetical protein DIS24_g11833 [Lasiodiplodia hormozganensis]|uniref:EF-hand domain-containing protein n=1 Tax=Lasiodiplodia hormozganensis TaxID=869390 RepID=A0AA40BVV7_9PEZI|nr:hypothetical protein DIS24_g11833 [Lasiodiplodia hormozganensis]